MAELVRGGCKPAPTPTQLDELFEAMHTDHDYFPPVMADEDLTLGEDDEALRDELMLEVLALRFGISFFKAGFRLPVPDDFTHEEIAVDDDNPILAREEIAGAAPHADGSTRGGSPSPMHGWHEVGRVAKEVSQVAKRG